MVSAAPLIVLALTVLLGILLNGYQSNKLGERIDRLDARIDRVEAALIARIDKLEAKIDKLDAKIDRVDAKHTDRFDRNLDAAHRDALEIMRQITSLHERVAVVENRNAA